MLLILYDILSTAMPYVEMDNESFLSSEIGITQSRIFVGSISVVYPWRVFIFILSRLNDITGSAASACFVVISLFPLFVVMQNVINAAINTTISTIGFITFLLIKSYPYIYQNLWYLLYLHLRLQSSQLKSMPAIVQIKHLLLCSEINLPAILSASSKRRCLSGTSS